ncbi:apoptosis regulator BAX-like isoform X2 [Dromaius novaehollandiae]|uniref:apoptosis regulator BAX-like isoform X2 n=1 Tax=Dromaius novaehollandiae TaxID=8790 RepID=UPI00311F84FC
MEGQGGWGALEAPCGAGAESVSSVVRIGAALLRGFVRSLLEGAPGPPRPVLPAELGDAEPGDAVDGPPLALLRDAALRVWARLSRDPEMDSLVGALAGRPALPALAEVSEELFRSGINWGRVVVFFYFTYRVVLQGSILSYSPPEQSQPPCAGGAPGSPEK